MLLTIFSTIYNSSVLLFSCVVLEIVAVVVMKQKADALAMVAPDQGSSPPDLWFGIPEDSLQEWLDGIGEEGRGLFLTLNTWDLAVYMWAYTLLSGALMYGQAQKANPAWAPLSLIFAISLLCDGIETILLRIATDTFPSPLSPLSRKVVSLSNMAKWSSAATGLVVLIGLAVKNRVSSSRKPGESAKTK